MTKLNKAIDWLARLAVIPLLLLSYAAEPARVEEDLKRAARWNQFVENLYKFHQERIGAIETYTKEEFGGYGGSMANLKFYREVRHYDKKTNRLLSNIKWETENPDNIHVIELYVYDNKGRIEREYTAAFLPVFRKAPYQTLINLHTYTDDLHAYRQFDASDNRIFESCSGQFFDEHVRILYNDYEIPDSVSQIRDDTTREAYRSCFEDMPKTAVPYMNPSSAPRLAG